MCCLLDAGRHPSEIVVFWFSRHGSPCDTVYPDTTVAEMRSFWSDVRVLEAPSLFEAHSWALLVTG